MTSFDAAAQWFRSFYVSPYMAKLGVQVLRPIYDLAARQGIRPFQHGAPYDFEKAMSDYRIELDEHTKDLEEYKQECADNGGTFDTEAFDAQLPREPLAPATWSFANGPLEECEQMEQIKKFDDNTLLRIVVDYVDPVFPAVKTWRRADLIAQVKKVVQQEYEECEMALEYHPILELTSGVLCLGNWRYLSASDLCKWAIAHGSHDWSALGKLSKDDRELMVEVVLKAQVEMLEEMVKKRQTGDGDDSRGYDRPRSILLDNKQSLNREFHHNYTLSSDDEPDRHARKRQRTE